MDHADPERGPRRVVDEGVVGHRTAMVVTVAVRMTMVLRSLAARTRSNGHEVARTEQVGDAVNDDPRLA